MTPQRFVDALRHTALSAAVEDVLTVLEAPPGRRPAQHLVEESKWYRSLPPDDRAMVARVLRRVSHATLFGVLAVLDGVRPVEDRGGKGELVLRYVKEGEAVPLCGPEAPLLHELLEGLDA